MATRTWDAWNYRESAEVSSRGKDLTGFSVEAVDGSIGKIDRPPSTSAAAMSSSTPARGSSAGR